MKIFISSTYSDLIDLRIEAKNYFEQYNTSVEAMEIWPASANSPLDWCVNRIKESDLVIGIYGKRYGSVDISTGKSLTELEYIEARNDKIPVLAFIMGHEYLIKAGEIDDTNNYNRQKEFIDRVKSEKGMCAFFNSKEEFNSKLHISFKLFLDSLGVDKLDLFNFNKIWDQIQEHDSKREDSLKIESIVGNNTENSLSEFLECIEGFETFHSYIQESRDKLGDDFIKAVKKLGLNIDLENDDNYDLWREFGIRDWEMTTLFPNRIYKLKIVYYHLKLTHLKNRLENELWTRTLQKEIEVTVNEYKKVLEKAYYID
jgi:hypothetical protein